MRQSHVRLFALISLLSACKTSTGSTLTAATDLGGFSVDLTSYTADWTALKDFRQEWDAIPGNNFCRLALRIVEEPSYRSWKLPYYKLKVEEAVAVQQYSQVPNLNQVLLKNDQPVLKKIRNIILTTASGLNRLPRYNGRVFRGAGLSDEVVNTYREALKAGTPIADKTFLSTSLNPEVAISFAKGRVLFIITSKSGHLIEGISLYKNEREVVFPPGSEFKVLSVTSKTIEEVKALSNEPLPAMVRVDTTTDKPKPVQGCTGQGAGPGPGGLGGLSGGVFTLTGETNSATKFFGPVGNVVEIKESGKLDAEPLNLLDESETSKPKLIVIELEDVTP